MDYSKIVNESSHWLIFVLALLYILLDGVIPLFLEFKKILKWDSGRQGTGYFKLKLFESKLFKFDVLILKYPKGSFIDFHKDPSPEGYEHHRLNYVLIKALGGYFTTRVDGRIEVFKESSLFIFKPDLIDHSVSEVHEGTRYVFSVGWLKKNKS